MQFDKLTPSDIAQIANLQPDGWPDILPDFITFISDSFCNPIKMVVDDEIVGVANSVIFRDKAWLAHIIVGVKNRSKGYGYHIVEYLLNDLHERSIESVSLIASAFGEPLYKKFGFETVSNYIFLERKEPWIEREVSDRIAPYESRFYSDIMRLDKEISGEEREPMLEKHIESSFVYLEGGVVRGFYMPTLGEGLIFAETTASGLALMSMKYAKSDIAVIPEDNEVGLAFLEQNGFGQTSKRRKRMILGKEIDWQSNKIYSRISGDYG